MLINLHTVSYLILPGTLWSRYSPSNRQTKKLRLRDGQEFPMHKELKVGSLGLKPDLCGSSAVFMTTDKYNIAAVLYSHITSPDLYFQWPRGQHTCVIQTLENKHILPFYPMFLSVNFSLQ